MFNLNAFVKWVRASVTSVHSCLIIGLKIRNLKRFDMIEAGGKFGVILTRLLRRYDAEEWAHVRVGEFRLCVQMDSWKAANATHRQKQLHRQPTPYVSILIMSSISAMWARSMLSNAFDLLVPGGLILTTEPEVPVDDVGDIPDSGPVTPEQAYVCAFQSVGTVHQ